MSQVLSISITRNPQESHWAVVQFGWKVAVALDWTVYRQLIK